MIIQHALICIDVKCVICHICLKDGRNCNINVIVNSHYFLP
jgi:hypothetical protein